MATGSGQELDLTKLVAIVLFLIVGGVYCRTFFHNYVSEAARAADRVVGPLDEIRAAGSATTLLPRLEPGPTRDYIATGDEQAKRQLIRDAKRGWRRGHSLAIWGSFAVACVSIIIVIGVGLSMLLERRA